MGHCFCEKFWGKIYQIGFETSIIHKIIFYKIYFVYSSSVQRGFINSSIKFRIPKANHFVDCNYKKSVIFVSS